MGGVVRASRPRGAEAILEIVDRREAIEQAVALARPGDVLVIAGKGHEQGQEFADGHKLPFDDVDVARDALRVRFNTDDIHSYPPTEAPTGAGK